MSVVAVAVVFPDVADSVVAVAVDLSDVAGAVVAVALRLWFGAMSRSTMSAEFRVMSRSACNVAPPVWALSQLGSGSDFGAKAPTMGSDAGRIIIGMLFYTGRENVVWFYARGDRWRMGRGAGSWERNLSLAYGGPGLPFLLFPIRL